MLLFLTATINPPKGMTHLARTDPLTRLNDYCDALKFYCSLPPIIDRILFVDNSGADVSRLREIATGSNHGKQIEILSYSGLDYDPGCGKAYGEFRLMDFGTTSSGLIQDDEPFWKVTGRLKCENLATLMATAPLHYDFYGDFKRWKHKWLDLRVFSCTVAAFRSLLLTDPESVKENVIQCAPEIVLYDKLLGMRDRFKIIPRMRREPRFSGINGKANLDYGSPRMRRKHVARAFVRRIAPFIWI